MSVVKLSAKRQLTLPAALCRALGLEKGARLLVETREGRIVLTRLPDDFTEALAGSAGGAYGATSEAVDGYVREERAAWE